MSKYIDMENVLRYLDKSKDSTIQMTALRLSYELNNVVPDSYFGLFDDDDVLALAGELWDFICQMDHNHCSLTECDYFAFVRDIVFNPLEEIHVLSEGVECGDWVAINLWKKILELRRLL